MIRNHYESRILLQPILAAQPSGFVRQRIYRYTSLREPLDCTRQNGSRYERGIRNGF